jgi:hypothetical protein
MDADSIADFGSRVKSDVGEYMDFLPKPTPSREVVAALQDRSRADHDLVAEDAMRTDMGCRIHLGRSGNY